MKHAPFFLFIFTLSAVPAMIFPEPLSAQIENPVKIQAKSGRLKSIADKGVLTVGMQKDYAPFHISDSEPLPGIDMELAQILARALGVKLSVKFLTLGELLDAVESGQVDISAGGISSSLERARKNAFSEPYLITTPAGLLSPRVLPPESESADFLKERIRSLGDISKLGSLKIGVMKNTKNEDLLKSDDKFTKHRIQSYTDRNDLVRALVKGEIDLLVADGVNIQSLIAQKAVPASFIPLTGSFREENICFALPRGDAELELYINFFIRTLKSDGSLNEILHKYQK